MDHNAQIAYLNQKEAERQHQKIMQQWEKQKELAKLATGPTHQQQVRYYYGERFIDG